VSLTYLSRAPVSFPEWVSEGPTMKHAALYLSLPRAHSCHCPSNGPHGIALAFWCCTFSWHSSFCSGKYCHRHKCARMPVRSSSSSEIDKSTVHACPT
jgi:hypothetical protein